MPDMQEGGHLLQCFLRNSEVRRLRAEYVHREHRKKGSPADLACGGYKLRGSRECSNHFIDYNHLCRIVLDTVSEHTDEHELSQDLLFRLIDRIEVGQGSYARMEQGRVKRQTIRIHVRFPSQNSVKECVI